MDIEITTLSIRRPHTTKMILILVYRPPNGNIVRAIEYLNDLVKFIPNLDTIDLVIGGDFNIDFSKSRKDNTKKLKHSSTKHNLTQPIKDPTRPIDSEATIDLIFSKCKHVKYAGVLRWNLSDHIPVFISIKKDKAVFEKTEFTGRSYRNFNQQTFLDMIRGKNWEAFYNIDNPDINRKWDILYKNILEVLDTLIPVKKIKFKRSRTKDPVDKRNARQARNKVNSLIRRAKNDFIKEKLENYSDNLKKFWEKIKAVMPITNLSNQIVLQDENGHKLKNCNLLT